MACRRMECHQAMVTCHHSNDTRNKDMEHPMATWVGKASTDPMDRLRLIVGKEHHRRVRDPLLECTHNEVVLP